MADELTRLRELNARLQLVPKGVSTADLEWNASLFTDAAAKLLHAEGWRRIRKTEGKNVAGMDIDKLVNIHTFECRDIVIAAGATNATVGWLPAGQFTDTSRFLEVRPDLPEPAPAPTPAPAPPADDAFFREAMMQLVNERSEANVLLDRIADALEAIAGVLRSAGKRFGLVE